jgi:hypothetical protein
LHDDLILAAFSIVEEFLKTFNGLPPRQKAASFTIDQVMDETASVAGH